MNFDLMTARTMFARAMNQMEGARVVLAAAEGREVADPGDLADLVRDIRNLYTKAEALLTEVNTLLAGFRGRPGLELVVDRPLTADRPQDLLGMDPHEELRGGHQMVMYGTGLAATLSATLQDALSRLDGLGLADPTRALPPPRP